MNHSLLPPAQIAPRRISVLGAPIDLVTTEGAVAAVDVAIQERRPLQHVAVNAAKVVRVQRDELLRDALNSCELSTADGLAVVVAARRLGYSVPERVAGVDLMESLFELAEQRDYRVYLLGARAPVLDAATAAAHARWPDLNIVGRHHGYFDRTLEPAVVAEIRAARPDMLFVALETPAKELFLARNAEELSVPFAMGVGGAFDVLAGVRRRAPMWMQRIGLEWLYRLAQDPRRLARRYLVGNLVFIALVLRALATNRIGATTA